MNRKKKNLFGIVLAASLVLLTLTTLFVSRAAAHVWPDFLAGKPGEPAYNFEVGDSASSNRNFGYRTGNHVPVSLYFRLSKGTELLTDQLVLPGDFQQVSKKVVSETKGEETLVRVDLTLQTFVFKPKWEVKPEIGYRTADGTVKKLSMLAVEVSSSNTFDGSKDKHPKEQNVEMVSVSGHNSLTALLVIAGIVGVLWAVRRLVRKPKVQEVLVEPAADEVPAEWLAVRQAWAAITGGDRSKPAFARATQAVRAACGLPTATLSEIKTMSLPYGQQLAFFLRVCEQHVWTDQPVEFREISQAGDLLAEIEGIALAPAAAEADAVPATA